MRGLILLMAAGMVAGCGSTHIIGYADTASEPDLDVTSEPDVPAEVLDASPDVEEVVDGIDPLADLLTDDLGGCVSAISFELSGECESGVFDSHDFCTMGGRTLNILGVHSGTESDHGSTVDVWIEHTCIPAIVVVSAKRSVIWEFHLGSDATIEHVYTNGYDTQYVSGIDSGSVSILPGGYRGESYVWPRGPLGDFPPPVVEDAERVTELEVSTFQGCYSAREFTIQEACE